MSTYPPPLEDVPIFNPDNWIYTETGVGLTEAQADLRYLIKTIPDTASAFETFQNGISTGSITAYNGNLVLGNIGANIVILGNTTSANIENLNVKDAQIRVNVGGVIPTDAGLEVESSNIVVSSLLNDVNADWVLTSSNNRIYLDEIQQKTNGILMNASNVVVTTNGNNKSEIHPTFICVNDGAGNLTGIQLQSTHGCVGTQNALDFQIKTNNTNRIDIDGTNGNVTISSTVASTSSGTGALVVAGGVGVSGNYYSAGSVYFNGGDCGTTTNTNLSLKTNNNVRGQFNGTTGDFLVTSSSASSNIGTGAIRTNGGIGCAKSLSVGESVNALGSANIGNTSAYALFLNTNIGVGNIGCSFQNSALGNTVIQPQHQGVAWRNIYLNPSGGLVAVGSSTPPNTTDKLYVDGTANINGILNITSNISTTAGNITVSGGGNIVNTSGNTLTGKLLVGTTVPFEDVPAKIQNSTSLDTLVNGTVEGSYNMLALQNASRAFVFGGGAGADNVALYLGSTGGVANDPDMFCRWDTNGRMMVYPPFAGNITAPNTSDLFTCRGNANISTNLWVGGTATLGNLSVIGTPTFTNLNITGNLNVQDPLYIANINADTIFADGIRCYGTIRTDQGLKFNNQPKFEIEKGILASGTTAITFASNFIATPSLSLTAIDTTNSGISCMIVDIDANGANIALKNTGNSSVSRSVHCIPMGNIL